MYRKRTTLAWLTLLVLVAELVASLGHVGICLSAAGAAGAAACYEQLGPVGRAASMLVGWLAPASAPVAPVTPPPVPPSARVKSDAFRVPK